ncbi:MAG: MBL fold metallo-hydrolase [Candidatus Cohnella colombiensis]|uniref:MBL fold metallo-hydrolase n=1 Tax=Candidatus Cohnella colombiensis TaxID=3121368 RepID=A0AA95JG35_9BACL|nr:MAG: MBL fold metallo-hydrolase [Cohnella sp.]
MPRRFGNLDSALAGKPSKAQFDRWRQDRFRKLKNKGYSEGVPNVAPDLRFLQQNRKESSITWIGHSTFLIQMAGLNIVTDPVWARRMAFRKRLRPPGIELHDMPSTDVVLISHSHYDHLHVSSLRRLRGAKKLIVPSGLRKKLMTRGFLRVEELQWWEQTIYHGVKITFVPAQHWTRRNPWDMNTSHWGGWVLEYDQGPTIYFAGDSGYFKGFKDIGRRFKIDIALMPIGAYDPEWFMSSHHVSPEEAIQAFIDVGAKFFIPMHYGAFKLADDTPSDALQRLEQARIKLDIAPERLYLLKHGETMRFNYKGIQNDTKDGLDS